MLLTNITTAVITNTQVILSNVIVELRVVSANLEKFAQKLMTTPYAKCPQWQAAAAATQRNHTRGTDRSALRDFHRSMARLSMSHSCCGINFGGCCS